MGTVGFSVPGLTWRLAALEEMGYDPLAQPARGELCLRGDILFSGYHLVRPPSTHACRALQAAAQKCMGWPGVLCLLHA